MLSKDVRPTTLVGIKRLARKLAEPQGPKHLARLDLAAQQAGFQNYRHAKSQLQAAVRPRLPTATPQGPATTYITAYWSELKTGATGRETIEVQLRRPWRDLVPSRALAKARALRKFRWQAADHLVCRIVVDDPLQARQDVCAAARQLAFMDVTGLQPNGAPADIVAGAQRQKLPRSDHASRWLDETGQFVVLVDEPYTLAVAENMPERDSWAARHGYHIVGVKWPGMYNPDGGSVMFMVAKAEHRERLEAWAAALNKLPFPLVATGWRGTSAPYSPLFRSPTEVARTATPRRPPDPRLRRATATTRPYAGVLVGAIRRPNGRMPIEIHEEVGRLLKEIIGGAYSRAGVSNRLGRVRSELDEWVQREFGPRELDSERFFAMYYGDTEHRYARTIPEADKQRYIGHLDHIEAALKQHYPDSTPLRWLLGQIDGARKSLASWMGR